MVVGVLTGKNAASAGAAQRRDGKLQEGEQKGNRKIKREQDRRNEQEEAQQKSVLHTVHSQVLL